jgi:hypothetical protein
VAGASATWDPQAGMPQGVPDRTRKRRKQRRSRPKVAQAESRSKRLPPRVPKPVMWAGGKIAGAILAAVVGTAFTVWIIDRPDSLPQQLSQIEAAQDRRGRQLAFKQVANLHGTGTKSDLLNFKDEAIRWKGNVSAMGHRALADVTTLRGMAEAHPRYACRLHRHRQAGGLRPRWSAASSRSAPAPRAWRRRCPPRTRAPRRQRPRRSRHAHLIDAAGDM